MERRIKTDLQQTGDGQIQSVLHRINPAITGAAHTPCIIIICSLNLITTYFPSIFTGLSAYLMSGVLFVKLAQ